MHITTLPLEIIDMILDLVVHVGDDFEAGRLSWETRRALRACSFISHLWLSECRKRLFRIMPAPYDDASLHSFKRLCSSPNLTFGPAHVRGLAVSGRSPSLWGWHWWRTHTRGTRAGDVGKRRGSDVSATDMGDIFKRFFDWTLHDAAAGRIFRTLGELRLLEIGFEDFPEDSSSSTTDSEWSVMSIRTRQSLHQSFPSLTKLVLKRSRFANEPLFVSLLKSFSRTLEVLDMDCVAIDGFEHRDVITEPINGRRKEALLPALRVLRLTGLSINLAIFFIPSPKLRKVMFDIPDDEIRREVPLPMLVDLVASAQNLQSLSLHNRCSGSFRDADIPTDGNLLSQLLAKAPSIEHLTVDIRSSLRPYLITLLSQTPNPSLTSLHIPDLQSLLVDLAALDDTIQTTFPSLQVLKFNCRVIVSSMAARRKKLSIPMPPLPSTSSLGQQAQVHAPSPYVPLFMVNMVDDDDDDIMEDDNAEGDAHNGPVFDVENLQGHEPEEFLELTAALSGEDAPYSPTFANLRMRLREVTRHTEDMDEIEDRVEEMLRRMKKEEEEVAVKMREEKSRQVFRKFARKLPWCEERNCLRPVFQFDA